MQRKLKKARNVMTLNQNDNAADKLAELLEDPKVESDDWQDLAGRLAAKVHTQMLQLRPENASFFQAAILATKAKRIGVKSIQKRDVKISGSFEDPIKPLEEITEIQNYEFLLEALATVKAPWVLRYVKFHIQNSELTPTAVSKLLMWGRINTTDANELLDAVFVNPLDSANSHENSRLVFKELIGSISLFISANSDEMAKLAEDVATKVKAFILAGNPEISKIATTFLVNLLDKLLDTAPLISLEGPFILAIGQLKLMSKEAKNTSAAGKLIDKVSTRLISTLASLASASPDLESQKIKIAVAHWRNLSSDFSNDLTRKIIQNPAIGRILRDHELHTVDDNHDELTQLFTQMLSASLDLDSIDGNNRSLEVFKKMVEEAAALHNVRRLGEIGDIEKFDPFLHRLDNDQTSIPNRVTICYPGVVRYRADGTFQVVNPAIVKEI